MHFIKFNFKSNLCLNSVAELCQQSQCNYSSLQPAREFRGWWLFSFLNI